MGAKADEMTPELLARVAARFAAMSDPTRLRLLVLLKHGESRVGDLAEAVHLSQPSTSKHLAILRQAGLVQVRRQGVEAFYAIRDETLFDLCDLVCTSVRQQAVEDVAGLALPTRRR